MGFFSLENFERFFAVLGLERLKTLLREIVMHELPDIGLVFDDEDFFWGHR
jgi:hypothetical protein